MKKSEIEKAKNDFAIECVEFTLKNLFNGKLGGLNAEGIVQLYAKKPELAHSTIQRSFRLKCRSVSKDHRKGKVTKQRDYVDLDKLLEHGKAAFNRYNRPDSSYYPSEAELYELIDGKWQQLNSVEIANLLFS